MSSEYTAYQAIIDTNDNELLNCAIKYIPLEINNNELIMLIQQAVVNISSSDILKTLINNSKHQQVLDIKSDKNKLIDDLNNDKFDALLKLSNTELDNLFYNKNSHSKYHKFVEYNNSTNNLGNIFLYACENNYEDLALLLLNHNLNITDINNALRCIAYRNNLTIMKKCLLLDNLNLRISVKQDNYDTPLAIACSNRNIEMIKILINDKKMQTIFDNNKQYLNYCFSKVCYVGDLSIIKYFLENPNIDPSDDDNAALLHLYSVTSKDIYDLLLNDDRFDITRGYNKIVNKIYETGNMNIINLILDHPKFNPSFNQNYALKSIINRDSDQSNIKTIILKILNHPKFIWNSDTKFPLIDCVSGSSWNNIKIIAEHLEKIKKN
jgi:hypothetical protein